MKKFGKLLALLAVVLLAGSVVAGAVVAKPGGNGKKGDKVVVDDKGQKYAIEKEKMPYFKALEKILHKKEIKKGDYKRIRVLLEKLTDREISDREWKNLQRYINEEHKEWVHAEERKSQKSRQSGSQTSTSVPSILALSSSDYLPIFEQPWVDINGRLLPRYFEGDNDLIKVYHYPWSFSDEVEITAVFKDEDYPVYDLDLVYDAWRVAQNGRIEDIETFYINLDSGGNPQSIDFSYGGTGTYSGTQEFFDLNPDHISETVQASEFSWSGDRPYIYVDTWNHLYGEDDNNPTLSDKTWTSYTTEQGTRTEAEGDF